MQEMFVQAEELMFQLQLYLSSCSFWFILFLHKHCKSQLYVFFIYIERAQ